MSGQPNLVIINADDFGLDRETNQAIIEGFRRGVLSSATIMANTPGFEDACRLIHSHGLQGRIGLHFNITHGPPLGELARRQPRLCGNDGLLDLRLPRLTLTLSKGLENAIRDELAWQWQRCLDHGVTPSHIDSHQHVHNLWPISTLVADFANAKGVPVRLARNLGRNIGPVKRSYKWLVNERIRMRCDTPVHWACTPRDLLDGLRPQGLVEIIAHPVLLADGLIGDDYLPNGQSLEVLLARTLEGFQRVSYCDVVVQ